MSITDGLDCFQKEVKGLMEEKDRQEKAKKKMEIIAPLLDPYLTQDELVEKKKKTAEKNNLSTKTVGRYLEAYKKGGYNALLPKEQLRPERRVIPVAVLNEAITLRKELNSRSVRTIIDVLESEGTIKRGCVKRSTLQRNLQESGWGTSQIADRTFASDKSALRFAKRHRMQLCQADIKYGPVLYIKGRKVKTYLVAWIDDFSRYILGGTLYSSQTAFDVHRSFRKMIETYGKPVALLCDNGSQYVAKILKDTCLRLGITIKHALPYAANCKGKIERFNKDVSKFVEEAQLAGFKSLEELNAYYIAWQERTHQNYNHTALEGGDKTPQEFFEGDSVNTPLNFVDKKDLDEAFLVVEERRVYNDGTFSLYGKLYEVENYDLRGSTVNVYYDYTLDTVIKVSHKDFADSKAHLLQIGENIDYGLKNKIRKNEFRKNKDKDIPADHGSRTLNAYRNDYEGLHPGTTLFKDFKDDDEEEPQVKKTSVINFGVLNRKEENNQ